LYLGESLFRWEKGGRYQKLTGALMLVLDSRSKDIMIFERDLEARINEQFWLTIRKQGSNKEYQWVIKIWQYIDIYVFE
jgi:hypothetical protein